MVEEGSDGSIFVAVCEVISSLGGSCYDTTCISLEGWANRSLARPPWVPAMLTTDLSLPFVTIYPQAAKGEVLGIVR